MAAKRVVIVGGGIFGVTAALALRRRGVRVTLLEAGELPHPLAESTDISKIVRMEYGADELYTELAERSLAGWRRWNTELGAVLFRETGVLFVRRSPLAPGNFEGDSLVMLEKRGHRVERLDATTLRERFPSWSTGRYVDGFFHAQGGYVESGRVVTALCAQARKLGVTVLPHRAVTALRTVGNTVTGVVTDEGELLADCVVLATGSWTQHLLPTLQGVFRSVGQPVFHLRPADPSDYLSTRFPVFGADISETGWYGFPVHPKEGVVKIANHGKGREMHPESPEREVTAADHVRLNEFLAESLPSLLRAPVVKTRVCVYSDTADGHFWIDNDETLDGLVVAGGGSGHAFKFAPVLGDLIADRVEGVESPALKRFARRAATGATRHEEAARWMGEEG